MAEPQFGLTQKQIELIECFKNGVDRESSLLANEQKARDGLGVVLNNSFQPMMDIVKELTAAQDIDLDVPANAKNFLEAMANGLPEEAEATKQFLLSEAEKLNKKDLVQKINDVANAVAKSAEPISAILAERQENHVGTFMQAKALHDDGADFVPILKAVAALGPAGNPIYAPVVHYAATHPQIAPYTQGFMPSGNGFVVLKDHQTKDFLTGQVRYHEKSPHSDVEMAQQQILVANILSQDMGIPLAMASFPVPESQRKTSTVAEQFLLEDVAVRVGMPVPKGSVDYTSAAKKSPGHTPVAKR